MSTNEALRVLVVDDCHDTTATTCWLLSLWDHDCRVAYDGATALEIAASFLPNVVLLDIALRSATDGYEVARQLRSMPGLENCLLICMTGYGAESDRKQAKKAGFDRHLVKPFNAEELARLLADEKQHRTGRSAAAVR